MLMFNLLGKTSEKPRSRGGNHPSAPPVRPRVYTQLVKKIFKSLINNKLKLNSGDSAGGGGGENAPFTPTPLPTGLLVLLH